jgi:nucleotide-binding universal stress UspA family protein
MYKKMLVILDGSKLAEVVSSYARELSGRLNLAVDLLHVCRPEEADLLPMRRAYIDHMAEEMISKTEGKSVPAQGHVVLGYPPDEILKYAGENQIDLIMLATHGVSGIRRWGLGSVADKIIHASEVPIWLVPAHLSETILTDSSPARSILIPLDGSKLAEAVIPDVKELIKQRGAEIEMILINVINQPVIPPYVIYWNQTEQSRMVGETVAALKTNSQIYLNTLVETLKKDGFKARAVQAIGDPTEEVIKCAGENKPGLIAMTTHGRSGLNRFVFGSVAENIMRRLQKTPLFLVKPKE